MTTRQQLEVKSARYIALKDYRRASRHLRELLSQVGENPQTLYMLAYCHERRIELVEALQYVERALRADPDHLEALQLIARIHVMREEHEEACEFVSKAMVVIARRRRTRAPGPVDARMRRRPPAIARWWRWARMLRARAERREQALWLDWAEAYLRHHGKSAPDRTDAG